MGYEKSGTLAVSKLACFSLPPSKHRWVSSVLVLPDNFNTSEDNASSKHCDEELGPRSYCVICGDRKGSVHVYRSRLLPVQLPGQMQEKSSTDKVLFFFFHNSRQDFVLNTSHSSVPTVFGATPVSPGYPWAQWGHLCDLS